MYEYIADLGKSLGIPRIPIITREQPNIIIIEFGPFNENVYMMDENYYT